MPIEIRELHIKVTVNEQEPNSSGKANLSPEHQEQQEMDEQALIANCVEQVLDILKHRKER